MRQAISTPTRGDDIFTLIDTTKSAQMAENPDALDLRLSRAQLAELGHLFGPGAIAGER